LPLIFAKTSSMKKVSPQASVLALQAAGINGPELDTPESKCFAGASNAALGQAILDIPVAQLETIVESNRV
jgi:hypothetical protein